LLAYLVGEFANSFVLAKMKIATGGRWLWSRTIGSTLIGQGLDSLVFISLAFGGAIPFPGLLAAIVTQWLAKPFECLLFTYLVVNFLKGREGHLRSRMRFSPFTFRLRKKSICDVARSSSLRRT
jgi:uncharacterized PurR-regulated membrane protein YhhQ (DUF165 family)